MEWSAITVTFPGMMAGSSFSQDTHKRAKTMARTGALGENFMTFVFEMLLLYNGSIRFLVSGPPSGCGFKRRRAGSREFFCLDSVSNRENNANLGRRLIDFS
jgi:hypothetical protein